MSLGESASERAEGPRQGCCACAKSCAMALPGTMGHARICWALRGTWMAHNQRQYTAALFS
jgi:hypothetical protein